MRRRDAAAAALLAAWLAFAVLLLFVRDWYGIETAADWWWAGIQTWQYPWYLRALVVALPVAALLAPRRLLDALHHDAARTLGDVSSRSPFLLFTAALAALWAFRQTDLRYADSLFYAGELVPREAFSARGLWLSYDEVFASVTGTWGHRWLSRLLHFDPSTTYNFIGIAVTASLLALLWHWRGRRMAMLGAGAAAMFALGNWNQVMLGQVEHYGPAVALNFLFVVLAVESVRGRAPLWQPCAAFGASAAFHLQIGFYFPALLYLLWRRFRAEPPAGRQLAVAALVLPAMFTLTSAYFFGFDLAFFFGSHASQGKLLPFVDRSNPLLAGNILYDSTLDPRRLAHVLCQSCFAAWPGTLALTTAAVYAPREAWRDPVVRLCAALCVCGGAFMLLWNNELPYYMDSNLYSSAGIGITALAVALLRNPEVEARMGAMRRRLLFAVLLSGLAWKVLVVLHHSVLSPNYAQPWVIQKRVLYEIEF
ncbi:MAG: hypothetical protein SF028_02600 [Candidatus Sumerlaeia bacterium]|nr:hypothetical protein [Candidatus Sumerlaeia bacterium]